MKHFKPNVVRGGRAIGLGNNLFLMKGRKHSEGGIDVGENPRTGLEVEDNEVMQVSPKGVKVFSAQPILGGKSPAQYVLEGASPYNVFNAQESWKKFNGVNDDGTQKKVDNRKEYVTRRLEDYDIFDDDTLALRQRFMESNFVNDSISPAGAKGAYQIMPHIYNAYVKRTGKKGDLTNYEYNKSIRDWLLAEDIAKNKKLMHDDQLPIVKLAKQYGAYNWGSGNLQKYLNNQVVKGIDINNSLDWLEGLPRETRDYINFIVLGKDANKYKNNAVYNRLLQKRGLKKFGGQKESNLTKRIKEETKKQENRDIPLPLRGEKPLIPLGYNIASYIPVIGDAIQLGESVSNIKNKNYITGAAGLALLAVPNIIEKPLKFLRKAALKYIKHSESENLLKQLSKLSDSEWDDAYKTALKNNDDDAMQGLRDLHNRTKAINSEVKEPMFHKGHRDIKEFDPDIGRFNGNTGPSKDPFIHIGTKEAANDINGDQLYELFVNQKNSLSIPDNAQYDGVSILKEMNYKGIIDDNEFEKLVKKYRNAGTSLDYQSEILEKHKTIREILENKGYDGIKYINEVEGKGSLSRGVLSSKQLKLRDYKTFDDNGNLIPLSKRDNFNIEDIRYALGIPLATGLGLSAVKSNNNSNITEYKYGGIHIKPSKRGTFTAAAKKHGMSVQGFASKVLANKGNYSPSMVKKANFARNASKWHKKEFGGQLNNNDMTFDYLLGSNRQLYKLGGCRKKAQDGIYVDGKLYNRKGEPLFSTVLEPTVITAVRTPQMNYDIDENSLKMSIPVINDRLNLSTSKEDFRINSIVNPLERVKNPLDKQTPANESLERLKQERLNNYKGIKLNTALGDIFKSDLDKNVLAANVIGNTLATGINAIAVGSRQFPRHIPLRAIKQNTEYNVEPELNSTRETVAKNERDITDNTASSRVAVNRRQLARNLGNRTLNEIYGQKENIVNDLVRRNLANIQNVGNQNIANINQWLADKAKFNNENIDDMSEVLVTGINNTTDAIGDYAVNKRKDKQYRMNLFLEFLKSPYAVDAINSEQAKQIARNLGIIDEYNKYFNV